MTWPGNNAITKTVVGESIFVHEPLRRASGTLGTSRVTGTSNGL